MAKANYDAAFDYLGVPKGSGRFCPIVPVTVEATRTQTFLFTVDSGAELTSLPFDIALAIGLDANAGQEIDMDTVGGGDKGRLFHSGVTLTICNFVVQPPVVFMPHLKDCLLGRMGIFPLIQVGFREARKKVYFAFTA